MVVTVYNRTTIKFNRTVPATKGEISTPKMQLCFH
jgi:hypothetical protein